MKKQHIIILAMVSILSAIQTSIAKDGCAKGWRKDGMGRCHMDTKKDLEYDKEKINDNLAEAAINASQQSFIDQFKVLAGAGVANITNLQIPTIPTSVISFITNNMLIQFTPAQIALFTPNQIAALTPGQTSALTTAQVTSLSSAQVAAMSPQQVAAMPGAQLAIILPKIIVAQTQALVANQIQYLSSAALATQLPNLVNRQIPYILVSQIQSLAPAALATITETQINNMTKAQLTAIQNCLTTPATINAINNPSLISSMLEYIQTAPGEGFTDTSIVIKKQKKYDDEKLHKVNRKIRKDFKTIGKAFGAK
jgi:hypothetical protein